MGPDAGPRPVPRPGRQRRPHRVEADIAGRGHQVRLVHGHAGKTALEQMAGPAAAGVDEVGVSPMGFAARPPQPVCRLRNEDQVDGVGHTAVGPARHAGATRLLGKEVAIDLLISVLEEDRLTRIAPLGHVVRETGNHDVGEAGHLAERNCYASRQSMSIVSPRIPLWPDPRNVGVGARLSRKAVGHRRIDSTLAMCSNSSVLSRRLITEATGRGASANGSSRPRRRWRDRAVSTVVLR